MESTTLSEAGAQPHLSRRQHWNVHLARHAQMRPDAVAVRFRGVGTTWSQLHRRVEAVAGALQDRGLRAGDRVLIAMLNCTEFVESYLAVNLVGAIAVPINFRLTAAEVAQLAADCEARTAITDGALADTMVSVRATYRALSTVVVVGHSPDKALESYEALIAERHGPPALVDVGCDDPALIMYTSGTTGKPKGAVLTHLNLMSQAMNMLIVNGADIETDVNFVGVPMFHIAGIGSMFSGLLLGIPTVIHPVGAFDAEALLDVVEAERVSSLFLVPAQWQVVCAAQRRRPRDLRLRVLSWGAAPASDALLRDMAMTFSDTKILAAFGQTEMSPVTCVLTAGDAQRKMGSVGKVLPTVAARVVDDDMVDVPVGEVGEIVYRGPTLMAGYWNSPETTAEVFRGGWFHSGDLVRQDDEGYIWVVDRKKDMIISGGENIYCPEIENVLEGHPAIAEASVIGRPDPKWGEVPIAFVVLAERVDRLPDLQGYFNAQLARYKHPKAIEVVDGLPRNPAGKVLKGELRQRLTVNGSR